MRLIDADKVDFNEVFMGISDFAKDIREAAQSLIDNQPDIERWIPVEERTPEKPKENPLYDNKPLEIYLVSVKNTDCVIRAFWNGASFTDGWEKLDVLAWMPLPEPYRPETLRGPGAKAGQDAAEPVFQSAT